MFSTRCVVFLTPQCVNQLTRTLQMLLVRTVAMDARGIHQNDPENIVSASLCTLDPSARTPPPLGETVARQD